MAERTVRVDPVHVTATPDPHRIRAAIADALAGHALGAGPEAEVARAVAESIHRSTVEGHD